MSGTALTTKYLLPDTQIIGAEPIEVNDAYRSYHKGEIVVNETINSIADGLLTNLSDKTFGIIKEHLDDTKSFLPSSLLRLSLDIFRLPCGVIKERFARRRSVRGVRIRILFVYTGSTIPTIVSSFVRTVRRKDFPRNSPGDLSSPFDMNKVSLEK